MEKPGFGPFADIYDDIEKKLKESFPGVPILKYVPEVEQITDNALIAFEVGGFDSTSMASGYTDTPCDLDFYIYVKHADPGRAQIAVRNVAIEISSKFHHWFSSWSPQPTEHQGSYDLDYDDKTSRRYEVWQVSFVLWVRVSEDIMREGTTDYEFQITKRDEGIGF
jgi:hypothetical protein